MTALAGHKLPWKQRAGLLGQLSSVMKSVWLSPCLQAVCSGHPADSSIRSGKAHQPCCASQELCARWFEWSLLLPTFLPHVSPKQLSPVGAGFPGSSLPSWQVMVCTQQIKVHMKDSPACKGQGRASCKDRAVQSRLLNLIHRDRCISQQ